MSEMFEQKKAKIIIIDPSGPVRQMMTDVIRTLGFETPQTHPSITETLQYLEAESADWLIIPLMADQPVNALHMLKIATEIPQLKTIRISLLLAEDERYVIPTAFELGALSWHAKPFTKESLASELDALLTTMKERDGSEVLTAATYLRKQLLADKNSAAQLDLERSLLDQFPGNAQILFEMAEPLAALDRKPQARNTLNQVKMLEPKLATKVDEAIKKLGLEGAAGDEADQNGLAILGVKSCVLIDSDETVSKAVEEILTSVGITTVTTYKNGEEAITALEGGTEPELIIMEWRIPRVTGPMLVQRIRQKFASVPIVVLSSLLKSTDMPLVREMGIANILQKPLNRDSFLSGMVHTMQQERRPTEHQTLERKIRNCFGAGQLEEAERLKTQFLAIPEIPLARKRQVEAEAAFYANNFTLARDAGVESLKLSGDSIIILNLLGKTFMRLADYKSALRCFKKAQDLSPNNIERLCNIAETQTELGEEKEAAATINSAKDLDPDSQVVADAEVKIAIANGDTGAAKSLMSKMESLSGLVAYMNNKAVAHAKCGLVDEAREMYANTVKSIPEDQVDTRIIVQYNLALALIKASDFAAAKVELEQVLSVKKSKVWAKANSLMQRLQESISKGSELQLRHAANSPENAAKTPLAGEATTAATPEAASNLSTEEDHANLMAMVEARKGDLCCYMIYTHPGGRDMRAGSLLAKPPRFKLRDAIEREEAMGAERVNKGA